MHFHSPHRNTVLFLLLALPSAILVSASSGARGIEGTDFIDCNDPCNGGDVNYELTQTIRTVELLGGRKYKGRMYDNPEDPTNPMGPTMRVKPGQSMWIKYRNNMTESIGKTRVEVYDYWKMLQNPGEAIKYQYYKKATKTPEEMIVDVPNIPKNFDNSNLHVHGLDVVSKVLSSVLSF